jgi:signal transduction histidine kinase
MEAGLHSPAIISTLPRKHRFRMRFSHSLLFRVAIGSFGFIGIVTITLFLAIDHFVTNQFETFRAERIDQAWSQIENIIRREKSQLAGFARLLTNDIDLKNSAYYFLFLEGEKTHPQAAIDRIARAFDLESVALWEPDGTFIVRSAKLANSLSAAPIDISAGNRQDVSANLVKRGNVYWFAASAIIRRDGNDLVRLQIGRRFEQVIDRVFNAANEVVVRVSAGAEPPEGAVRRSLKISNNDMIALDIRVPNTVAAALEGTKAILFWTLGGFGLFLTVAIFSLLRWQLKPVRELTLAAAAVGRGNFDRSVEVKGAGELAELSHAFNTMASDLRKLRDLESQLRHKEQLSAIGRVAAKVAHDINNPLTVIRNAATLMRRDMEDNDPDSDDLDRIIHHCNRSIAIVQDLLHYGRPVVPRLKSMDFNSLCADIVSRWCARDSNLPRIRIKRARHPLIVLADSFQIEQLLNNLLDNAHEANPLGDIKVALSENGSYAFLQVIDAGSGFSEEARRHLFEPFFTTKNSGTGLGLASALSIARAHKGDIEIGVGDLGKITVRFPLEERPR